MSNKIKDRDIKNHTYYFFDDNINIKNFDLNNIKIDERSYRNILIYNTGYVNMMWCSKYVKINSVNPLYLVLNKVNGYFEEINGNKYLVLVPTNESKEIKKYKELWIKIIDLIKSITTISDDYDKNYTKINFNLDDKFPLNKMIEISTMKIVVTAVFHENKYYPQVFLDECLHKS